MFCKFCGAEIDDDCVVCPACGKQVADLKTSSVNSDGSLGATIEGKNKLVAGLLGILVGSIGAHHIYLGNTTAFILSLLFCWTGIPGIIGLIQGIIILCESDEDFARRVIANRK